MHEGRVPLHTMRADIDYGFTEAHTIMGRIGIKIWIYKGDILPELKTEESGTVAAETVPAVPPVPVAVTQSANILPAAAQPGAVSAAAARTEKANATVSVPAAGSENVPETGKEV